MQFSEAGKGPRIKVTGKTDQEKAIIAYALRGNRLARKLRPHGHPRVTETDQHSLVVDWQGRDTGVNRGAERALILKKLKELYSQMP